MIGVSSIIDNNEDSTPVGSNTYLFKGDYQGTRFATNAWGIYVEGNKNYLEGNLGVGTTNPIQKLHVLGSGYINGGSLFIDSGQRLKWGNSNQWIEGTNDTSLEFSGGSGGTQMILTSDGSVGIGTGSPAATLEVAGNSILDKKSILRLPSMNMGSGGITDEYLVIARKYDGVNQNATGIIGKIIFSRGGTSAGNNPSEYYINIQCAYNGDALNNLTYTGTEIFNSLDVIDISGTDYYALKVRTGGGGSR